MHEQANRSPLVCCVTLCAVVSITSQKWIVQELYEYICILPKELRHTQMATAALYAVTNTILYRHQTQAFLTV